MLLPKGGSVKCILLPTKLYEPRCILADEPSLCDAAVVPATPLSTSTKLNVPVPVIGPIAVVPNPTNFTFMNSSSTFKRSPLAIVPIPDKENILSPAPTDP